MLDPYTVHWVSSQPDLCNDVNSELNAQIEQADDFEGIYAHRFKHDQMKSLNDCSNRA